MKNIISWLLILTALIYSVVTQGEENNPCLHSWSDTLYDCNTSVTGASVSVNCKTTTTEAVAKIRSASTKNGSCKKYKLCSKCGERNNLGENSFSNITCGTLDCPTDPSGHIEGGGSCKVSVSCHTTRESTGYVSASGHTFYLMTDKEHTDEYKCYMTGRLKYDKYSVSLSSFKIPIGSTHYFDVTWVNPATNGVTDGYNEYKTKSCSVCGKNCTWETSKMTGSHKVEHTLPPESSGVYIGSWYGYGFNFSSTGNHTVKFTKRCVPQEISFLPYWDQKTSVGDCEKGEYEFNITSVGIQSLDYSPKNKTVYFKEAGQNTPKEKTLYVLSEITAEQAENGGNKARSAKTITFTAIPTGGSWPSTHPELGGISDSNLSDGEKETKANYKYPTWSRSHSYCNSSTCIPEHYEFTGNPGSSTATFEGKSVGSYVIDVSCGTESNPADSNDNLGTRRRFIKVCNPLAITSFAVSPNAEKQKVLDDLTPCSAQPIPITFGGDMNGIPEGEKAYLKIEADPKTYELYKDPAGEIEASAADLMLEVTGSKTRKTVYLLPIQKDSDTLISTYKAVTKYGIAETLVKSDDIEDILTVNWRVGGCAGGMCSAPWVNAKNSSVKVQGSFGHGAWGKSGGAFQIYADKLNYRLLDNKVAQIGKNEDEDPIMSDPCILFIYGNSSNVKIATAEDAASNNLYVEGYPIRVKTGRYCTEFTYRKATVGAFTFVDKMTVTQYLSSDMDASVAMTGISPVAVTTLEMVYNSSVVADATEPVVTALNVTNTQYSEATSTTQTWVFTAPETSCPDLTGNYTISQLSQNGVNNILVKQEYTNNGMKYRREIRYIGSMAAPVSKEDRTYCEYPWGEEVISETVKGATTTYEFYTDSAANGYSKPKKIIYPQGNHITYEYNAEHEVIKQTELRGSLTYVTTFEYEYDANAKKRTTTTIQKVENTVIAKNKSVTYENRTGNNPAESIRFDENGNQYVTKTWYTQGPNGTYDIRPRRQENPDGTATVYTYSRSGNSETNTTETGVFNGDTLTLGTRQVSVSNIDGANLSTESWFIDSANEVSVKTASTVNSNFDEFGRARTTTYLDGSAINRTYGCCGVASETDRNGVVTTYAYDDFKRISHTERDGITTFYSYDALGNQVSVTTKGRNDGELTTTSTYSNGELATSSDAMGNVTSYSRSYTASGNDTVYTETTTNPDSSTQIITSVNGQQTAVGGTAVHGQTMSYGADWQKIMPQNQTSYTDMLGRNYKTEYADGSYSMNYYNSKNHLVKSVTPAGVTTLYVYDALGRQITQATDMNRNGEIDSADLVTSVAYTYGTQDGKNVSITTQTRSQGNDSAVISVQKQSVDGLEQWQTNLNGLTTHSKNERLGNGNTRQTVTNPDGSKVITNLTNGRVISVQNIGINNSEGITVAYTYDEFNRQSGMTQTENGTTFITSTMTYNAAGQPLTQTVNGRTTSIAYNVVNRTRTMILPGDRTITEIYYPTGELQRISGADTYTQEWTYDPVWGQKATLTTYKDSNTSQITTWIYNNRGNLAGKKYPNNNGPSYTYDADGNLLTRSWERGITTTYTYDNAGRLLSQNYSDNTPGITASYDYLNRIVSLTDASGTRNFTYNANQQLASETIPYIVNLQSSFTYDNFGRRTLSTLQLDNTTVSSSGCSYNAFGRIASVSNDTDTLSYTYRPGGQLSLAGWTNGQNTALSNQSYEYDQYNRLTGIKLNNADEVSYTLNEKDQRTVATYANSGLWNFTYDDKSQLTGASGNDSNYAYTYDGIGNRVTAAESNNNINYTSNLLNQYTLINSSTPSYDADGNMLTSGNGWIYTYNGENRIVQATNGSTTVIMTYDYLGRRISKMIMESGAVQNSYKYVYDGFKLIAVYNDDVLSMTFTWQPESLGMDVPVSMTYNGATYYYVTDGNKNVTALLDATGNRVAEYVYGPFGQTVSATGTMAQINPFRFSSEFHDDETGLIYYNYRYYSPALGRWTKCDPIEEQGGVNLYAISNNNAIVYWDLFGLKKNGCCGKDVTEVLNQLLGAVKTELTQSKYATLITNPFPMNPGTGWDILQFNGTFTEIHWVSFGDACNETAAYSGKCYKMTALNYVLWGVLASVKRHHLNQIPKPIFPFHMLGMPGLGVHEHPEAVHFGLAMAYLGLYKGGLAIFRQNDEPYRNELSKFSMVYSGIEVFYKGTFDNKHANCKDCKVRAGNEYKYTGNLDAIIMLSFNDYIRINNKGDVSHHDSQAEAQSSAVRR